MFVWLRNLALYRIRKTYERTNERTSERTNERANERTSERTDKWMNERMNDGAKRSRTALEITLYVSGNVYDLI